MRFLMVLLLLAVFFLTGLVVGMDKNENDTPVNIPVQEYDATVEKMEEDTSALAVEKTSSEDMIQMKTPDESMTQKTASFLEGAVKGFYNLVVSIIYQFAKAFF